jgi:hypothetical protein
VGVSSAPLGELRRRRSLLTSTPQDRRADHLLGASRRRLGGGRDVVLRSTRRSRDRHRCPAHPDALGARDVVSGRCVPARRRLHAVLHSRSLRRRGDQLRRPRPQRPRRVLAHAHEAEGAARALELRAAVRPDRCHQFSFREPGQRRRGGARDVARGAVRPGGHVRFRAQQGPRAAACAGRRPALVRERSRGPARCGEYRGERDQRGDAARGGELRPLPRDGRRPRRDRRGVHRGGRSGAVLRGRSSRAIPSRVCPSPRPAASFRRVSRRRGCTATRSQ